MHRIALSFTVLVAMMVVTAGTGDAQTWQWQYVAHVANHAPITAQSTVVLSGNDVSVSYTAPIGNRQTVISSCRAMLSDVQTATTTRTPTGLFLVIHLKPGRVADCGTEKLPAAVLPAEDARVVDQVAAAINHASGATTVSRATPSPSQTHARQSRRIVAQAPTPTPAPTASPTPAPTASPTPSPRATRAVLARVVDWVQNEGLFTFVRVRNTGNQVVTITDGAISDCRNVDFGCGALTRHYILDPAGVATIATVASAGQRSGASFTYHYTAVSGKNTIAGAGSSTKTAPPGAPPMSPQELRSDEAVAIAGLRGSSSQQAQPQAQAQPQQSADSPPRLLARGSSRLGVGQTGTALVRVMVAADGRPEQAQIVKITNPALTAAAIETAVSSTYAPEVKNGQKVAGKYIATFSFNGEDPATVSIPVWKRSPAPAAPTPSSTP